MLLNLDTNTLALVTVPREKSLPISIPTKTTQQQPLPHSPNDTDPESRFKKFNLHQNAEKKGNNSNNGFVLRKTNVHSKCSTKWVRYNGRIPAILHNLNTIHDLDKALRPWQERLSKKEMSIILKEQVCWERAFEIFEWLKKKGCYELNVIHYNIMFWILGKGRKWRLVESLWNEMNVNGVVPVNSTYGTLIDVYSKGGLKEEALGWLQRMKSQGIEPDEVTMGVVVQLYKRAGEFRKAEEFFRKWSRGEPLRVEIDHNTVDTRHVCNEVSHVNVCLNSHTYNALIDTYGKAGQIRAVYEIFAKMIKQGVVPTTVTFNTMIHLYGNHGRIRQVSLLFQRMEELQCPPDTRTYNILISVCVKHNNINLAGKYLAKMKEAFLEPDLVSYRTILYAYSTRKMVQEAEELIREMDERGFKIDEFTQSALTRMYVESEMLEKSWLWFMQFHLAGNMTSSCYSASIDAYGERGYTLEAEKVFLCCKERKKLSVLVFNVMIKAYGIGKCYDKACQVFDCMEKFGIVANECSYSSLIHILASADKPHIAKPYLKKMQEAGLVSDCIPYCAVISNFAKSGQLDAAEELYTEMIGYAVQPDVIIYGVLINAFADSGNVKKATNYLDQMRQAGLPGNYAIHNSLIKLYTKVGYLKDAQETYKLFQLSDQGPSVFSSNCMIDLYTERLMIEQAKEIFESLKKNSIANEFSYAMMLCMYKKIGRLDEATQIAKQMRKLGLLTDLLSYNNVLGLYSMDRRLRDAKETFKEMIESGIQPDDFTFRALGNLLLNFGVSKQNIGRLEVMVKRDTPRGLKAWMVVLSRLLDGNDYIDDWK
ncbi:pentatricopeptide repeat-containing protein At3g23020-like [Trifolium pratense]|uniref:pentatricopeptide repeat-containing protein At3g23020-like n=1 Tax=Trifolium pratense TaxID=57577 RepID=UPI001E6950B0|nr:pentatricopeptide repeat-containing protein At3g23020-like [Trifolium pratense]XP_045814944.1 pentatricopeptide repeat-containing protein At3g23020-like [Trifolium pratense]